MNEEMKVYEFPVADIRIATENDLLYDRFTVDNFDDRTLLESVREKGVLEPLVITSDRYLLSGHRRLSAARLCNFSQVPVRVMQKEFEGLERSERVRLLSDFNQQRDKSGSERINEALAQLPSPTNEHRLVARRYHRKRKVQRSILDLGLTKKRPRIKALQFLRAIKHVIQDNEEYWPITARRVHYLLLNDPPLKHDKKPDSRYKNDQASYKALINLLTRARLNGDVPMESIEDPTRPIMTASGFDSVEEYIRQEMSNLFAGYRRDLQTGQPHHIEIILEKNALRSIIEDVADEYGIPVTTARGFLSLPPKAGICQRFKTSKKDNLVLLFLTDFDPDGEEIAKSTARSLRDDFGVSRIHPVKVALTYEDIMENALPSDMDAKPSSVNYRKFLDAFGTDRAVELDAAPVELLQKKLRNAIESHMDMDEFNRQLEIESEDNRQVHALRIIVQQALSGLRN